MSLRCSSTSLIPKDKGITKYESSSRSLRNYNFESRQNDCTCLQVSSLIFLTYLPSEKVFLKSMNDFGEMNPIYENFFEGHKPARSTVEVSRLPKDVMIEIECIAAL
jgi:hypothetical protein